jgi:hypothetical protein
VIGADQPGAFVPLELPATSISNGLEMTDTVAHQPDHGEITGRQQNGRHAPQGIL